jgi:OmpA-OmpF porin, OOP family
MGGLAKAIIGAVATALLGYLTFSAVCKKTEDVPAVSTPSPAEPVKTTVPAAPAVPATAEAVTKCQGDIDALMAAKTIKFQSGSAYLAPESNAVIAELATSLKSCAGTQIEVQGHTDLIGNAGVNQNLSQARADTVMKSLIEKGVAATQLTAKGYGLTAPIENATTPEANAKNRRTVFKISTPAAAPTSAAPAPTEGQ